MMIISLIIKLSKKINWLDQWIKQFIQVYSIQLPALPLPGNLKKHAEEICKQDIARVMTYEKLGKFSGLPAPRIIKQPK